jgi:hypothetical protein
MDAAGASRPDAHHSLPSVGGRGAEPVLDGTQFPVSDATERGMQVPVQGSESGPIGSGGSPDPREFRVFSRRSGNWGAETGSRSTAPSANQSASAENPPAEREHLFRTIAEIYPPVNDYQIAASNPAIRIVALEPVDWKEPRVNSERDDPTLAHFHRDFTTRSPARERTS